MTGSSPRAITIGTRFTWPIQARSPSRSLSRYQARDHACRSLRTAGDPRKKRDLVLVGSFEQCPEIACAAIGVAFKAPSPDRATRSPRPATTPVTNGMSVALGVDLVID